MEEVVFSVANTVDYFLLLTVYLVLLISVEQWVSE